MKKYEKLSFKNIKTFSVQTRTNLVNIRNMSRPYEDAPVPWPVTGETDNDKLNVLVDRILKARSSGKPVIWSMGAHVIKNGLSRYIIEMVRKGFLTHVSGNGATSIHDFELAYLGETSEDVARAIEDGSFGMWEETGRFMNEAIQQGSSLGHGYGESLYSYLERYPERFPHYDDCVFVQCQKFGVPYTCHISIGTDIIHQHPKVDFEALGRASGRDFESICQSVSGMHQGGVFLNFGSAISGPEVFLKALSLCRNIGLEMSGITAASFDIVPIFEESSPSESEADYYYRPRRNLIERLGQIGGKGMLFQGLHQVTIPQLFHRLRMRMEELNLTFPPYSHCGKLKKDKLKLYSIKERVSRIDAETLKIPDLKMPLVWTSAEDPSFLVLTERLKEVKSQRKQLLVNLGGNIIGSGVSLYLIDLIQQGWITHLAMNGAVAFQDFEVAAFGQTEELDSDSLVQGKLGMWKEPGDLLHAALRRGYINGLGFGESLMSVMEHNPEQFPFRHRSLLQACLDSGIPYTVHITLGTDSIHQHPTVDFAVQGGASGRDFQIYANTVSQLENGAFLNFGSTVTGPEVFLKALSIVRNLQYEVHHITTANFDIIQLGDYHKKVGYEDWDYYYRPRKNIIHRPTSLGGKGYHFEGLHQNTIPALWRVLMNGGDELE